VIHKDHPPGLVDGGRHAEVEQFLRQAVVQPPAADRHPGLVLGTDTAGVTRLLDRLEGKGLQRRRRHLLSNLDNPSNLEGLNNVDGARD
jgi:hypothetical protein